MMSSEDISVKDFKITMTRMLVCENYMKCFLCLKILRTDEEFPDKWFSTIFCCHLHFPVYL